MKLPTAIFLAGASLDNITTQRFLLKGDLYEVNPFLRFANNDPVAIGAAAVATDALTLWLARRYSPKHPRLVRVALIGLGSVRLSFGFHNLGLEPTPSARCTRREQSPDVSALCAALPIDTRSMVTGQSLPR